MTVVSNVLAMQVEQALYGECSGGHSLLATSGDDAVSTGIVQRLDLPDTAPPGVEWSPFLRGFPYRDRYVLARTFRDTAASRGGMVFSHALLVPLDEIGKTTDLGPLLELLATSHRQRPEAKSIQFVGTETPVRPAIDLMDTAEALVASSRWPVVRLGHVGFDDLVVALWARLLPEIRRDFAFRLSLGPRDLIETPMPALVCTPPAMTARWSEYPIIRSVAGRKPDSLAATLLSGDGKAAPLSEFMREMGLKPATFSELRLVEQAYRLDIGEPTLERRVGALRLIQKLSPDSDVGKKGKDLRVRRLCELVQAAGAEEILLLRNLHLSALPSPSRIWTALEKWVAKNEYPEDQDVAMLSVLEDATTRSAAVREWRTAVLGGLAVATDTPESLAPKAFWRWLQVRPNVVAALFRHVPVDAEVEQRLAFLAPVNLEEAAAEALVGPALARGWLRLHGAVLSASCSTLEAGRRQVLVDTDPSFLPGLQAALRHATPGELVECALEIEDPRLPRLAGEAVAKEPRLLAEVDVVPSKAQAVWREALAIDLESWRGPADPAAAFRSILDRLLSDGDTDPVLLERLSGTPVADLGSYPRRARIWSRVGDVALQNLLTATAKGWLRQAASVGGPFVIERDLQTAILEDEQLEETLDSLIPRRVGTAVRIVRFLVGYEQRRFLLLIGRVASRTTSLDVPDAECIGRLVLERGWQNVAADLIARYRTGRRDLKPALRSCCDMLGFWDRFSLGLTRIPEQEKWEGFRDLCAELYPGGPDDGGLWERAGGYDADLAAGESGRTRWLRAVRNIRNGKGPTPLALLDEMQKDFPNNERIAHLSGDGVLRESLG